MVGLGYAGLISKLAGRALLDVKAMMMEKTPAGCTRRGKGGGSRSLVYLSRAAFHGRR